MNACNHNFCANNSIQKDISCFYYVPTLITIFSVWPVESDLFTFYGSNFLANKHHVYLVKKLEGHYTASRLPSFWFICKNAKYWVDLVGLACFYFSTKHLQLSLWLIKFNVNHVVDNFLYVY